MNGKFSLACAALVACGAMTAAHADGGTIYFQGMISEPTCGLQQSGQGQAVLISACPGKNGLTQGRVQLSDHMGTVSVGANHATLTLRPVTESGVAVPGVYVVQVQYL